MRSSIAIVSAALSVALASCRCDVAANRPPVELTHAYFPELFDAGPAAPGGFRDAAALRVRLPLAAPGPIELTARGHTFRLAGVGRLEQRDGAAFAADGHFWL